WPDSSVVQYLTAADRQQYRLRVRDGKIVDAQGSLFDTADASSAHQPTRGYAIFVMSKTGEIYASKNQIVGRFHHSSFLAGAPVASAGELKVSNGVLKEVTIKSGHYRPNKELNEQLFTEL